MPAKWLGSFIVVAGLAAGGAWAMIGPDSIYQNQFVDPEKAKSAMGRLEKLYPDQPNTPSSGEYQYIILLPGIQPVPKEGEGSDQAVNSIRTAWSHEAEGFKVEYRTASGGKEFTDRYCVLVYTFNPAKSRRSRAEDFHLLIENHPVLTQASAQFDLLGWSEGGNIAHYYAGLYGERKIRQAGTLNTPHFGAYFPDEILLAKAFRAEYGPLAGDQAFKAVQKNSPFDVNSPGIQGLKYGCPELLQLHKAHPFTGKWRLYASSIPPNSLGLKGKLTTALLASEAFVFKSNPSNLPARGNYREAAKVIRKCETLSGKTPSKNDGMVTWDSMWAEGMGIKHQAHLYDLGDNTHSEIVVGKGDYTVLRKVMQDFGWLPPATITTTLPVLPSGIHIPVAEASALSTARVLTVRDGIVYAAKERNQTPIALNLGIGRCVWAEWSGDQAVISTDDSLYLAEVKSGQLTKIATGGPSTLGSVDEDSGRICFYREGELVTMDTLTSTPRSLGCVVANPIGPPQLLGKRLYWLDQLKLYSVPITGGVRTLEEDNVTHIRRAIKFLLVEKRSATGMSTTLLGALPFEGGAFKANLGYLIQYQVDAEQVDVDTKTFEVYLIIQGSLYYLDRSAAQEYETSGVTPSFEEVFQPCGQADSMDIK